MKASKKRTSVAPLPDKAKRAALPPKLAPQLATLVDRPPDDDAKWQYEVKL